MHIVAISDLHGYLPPKVPVSDLVLIAGDVCPDTPTREEQAMWLRDVFAPWAAKLETRAISMCWGNHDFVGLLPPGDLPPLPAEVLTDQGATVEGITIYATPWTRTIPGVWAFDVELDELAARMEAIPTGIDVLMTHGPPSGVLDRIVSGRHVGSVALAVAAARVRPRLHVFGHIHEARGQEGTSYNVSVVNKRYQPYALPLTEIDL